MKNKKIVVFFFKSRFSSCLNLDFYNFLKYPPEYTFYRYTYKI